jgi:glycerol-3-phosphate dehydrogenase (NAD(P)+)
MGHDVAIWCNEAEVAADIRDRRENERFLPGVRLPAGLASTTDPLEAATDKDVIILAVPSPASRSARRRRIS